MCGTGPGELIQVDVKKVVAILGGGGCRIRGRGWEVHSTRRRVGYRYLHVALDDRSYIVHAEVFEDERAEIAAGFLTRAGLWFAGHGIDCGRILTGSGPGYRSRLAGPRPNRTAAEHRPAGTWFECRLARGSLP